MNKYKTSTGDMVSQATIDRNYSMSLKAKHAGCAMRLCEGCGYSLAVHNDHTISRKRCKELGLADLIWEPKNFVSSCEKCHHEWEDYKSGNWILHKNVAFRLWFMRKHDHEGFMKRMYLNNVNREI